MLISKLLITREKKLLNTKLQAKKFQNLEFALFSITNLLQLSANNFLQVFKSA